MAKKKDGNRIGKTSLIKHPIYQFRYTHSTTACVSTCVLAAARPEVLERVRRAILANDPEVYPHAYRVLAEGDAALAEAAAKIIWPALTLFFAMAALMTACARTANAAARLPVAVVGAIALWTTGAFGPGALDHHNIQIALSLGLSALLLVL